MNFCPGVEIDFAFLVAFSEDYALAFVEVQVGAVHSHEFSYSHSGGGEQVNEGKVSDFCAVVAELFELFICYGFFYQSVRAYFVDSAYRAFEYEVFVFEPGEEAGEDPPYVVDGDLAKMSFLLVFCKIGADVIGRHFFYWLLYRTEHFCYCVLIVCKCFCGTTFYLLCGDESGKEI